MIFDYIIHSRNQQERVAYHRTPGHGCGERGDATARNVRERNDGGCGGRLGLSIEPSPVSEPVPGGRNHYFAFGT